MSVLTISFFLYVTECHSREQNCKCHCGNTSYTGYDPHKCSATRFTTSVLSLHAVCIRGLKCASEIDLNRNGSLNSPLAAVDVVCQSSAVFFSEPGFEAASPVFLVLNKSLHLCDTGAWSLNCLFSLRYAADTVQGQSSAFII